jgi:hypothetical protein
MNVLKPEWKALRIVLIVLAAWIVIWMVMDFNRRVEALRRLTAEQAVVKEKYNAQLATQEYLKEQVRYATSIPAVERWAYSEGHMARPGDNVIVPLVNANATQVPTPTPVFTPTQPSNLESWLALLFSAKLP